MSAAALSLKQGLLSADVGKVFEPGFSCQKTRRADVQNLSFFFYFLLSGYQLPYLANLSETLGRIF